MEIILLGEWFLQRNRWLQPRRVLSLWSI